MGDNGNWAQLLTLGAVVLGGAITLATTWLANLQQNADRARERREERLMPVYFSLHIAVWDWITLLESHALAGFPRDESSSKEAKIRDAREGEITRNSYEEVSTISGEPRMQHGFVRGRGAESGYRTSE